MILLKKKKKNTSRAYTKLFFLQSSHINRYEITYIGETIYQSQILLSKICVIMKHKIKINLNITSSYSIS